MDIRVECSDRRTSVNVHNIKPRLVDLTHDNNALYALKNDNDADTTTDLSVFFYTAELVSLRRQIDAILEQRKARLLADVAAMPEDLNIPAENISA